MKIATKTTAQLAWHQYLFSQVQNKYLGIEERFVWLVGVYPQRLQRLFRHLIDFKSFPKNAAGEAWWFLLIIYVLECTCIAELYESASSIIKFNTRPLTDDEIALGLSVFGETMDYELVRLDERARIATRKGKIAYVSFHTINSWGQLSAPTFIHELMHVWQYERMGAMYIPRALRAQHSAEGYNYQGVKKLIEKQEEGLKAFNLEQQAAIIEDYFRIKNGYAPRWSSATINEITAFEPYIRELSRH